MLSVGRGAALLAAAAARQEHSPQHLHVRPSSSLPTGCILGTVAVLNTCMLSRSCLLSRPVHAVWDERPPSVELQCIAGSGRSASSGRSPPSHPFLFIHTTTISLLLHSCSRKRSDSIHATHPPFACTSGASSFHAAMSFTAHPPPSPSSICSTSTIPHEGDSRLRNTDAPAHVRTRNHAQTDAKSGPPRTTSRGPCST